MSEDNINGYQMREPSNNVVSFPSAPKVEEVDFNHTPVTDKMILESQKMDKASSYKSELDWEQIRKLEIRANKKPIRGGFLFKTPFKLVNSHATCQQCLYAFEVDTYGRGCVHNCVYCYAKDQLTSHGYWNRPYPVPVDINAIRKVFHTVFESDKKSKWREIMERRTPIRIGSMSDSFMMMDSKIGVTKEFLKILNHYKYPYLIFTRSDLVARDDYMSLVDPSLASVQFSMSSTNDSLNKMIEPGAPSAGRRLKALRTLNDAGIWTTVRLNPFFPIYPDGYFTNPEFEWAGEVPKFDFSSFDMVDEIAAAGTKSILAGVVRLSTYALNQIEQAAGINYKQFFSQGKTKSTKDYHYSDAEIRYYYERIKEKCVENKVEFTTCYIGNGEQHFWKDQDLWSNKKDCCNAKGRVSSFNSDSRDIKFEDRLKFTNHKCTTPVDPKRIHKPLGVAESDAERFLRSITPPSRKSTESSPEVLV